MLKIDILENTLEQFSSTILQNTFEQLPSTLDCCFEMIILFLQVHVRESVTEVIVILIVTNAYAVQVGEEQDVIKVCTLMF